MKNITRKLFACLIAMIMVIQVLPVTVFAAETGGEGSSGSGDDTQSSNSVQMDLQVPASTGPQEFSIGGNDRLALSTVLRAVNEENSIKVYGGSAYGDEFYDGFWRLTDADGNTIAEDYFYYGNLQGINYDGTVTGLEKIDFEQYGRLYVYMWGTDSQGWVKFTSGKYYIPLFQDQTPVDRTYRALLSDLGLKKDGSAVDANEVAGVSFIDRSGDDREVTVTAVTGEQTYTSYNGTDNAETITREIEGGDFLLASRTAFSAGDAILLTMKDGSVIRINIPKYTYTATTAEFTLSDIYQQIGLTEDHDGLLLNTSDSTHQKIVVVINAAPGAADFEEKTIISLNNPDFPAYLWMRNTSSGQSFYIDIIDGGIPAIKVYQDEQFLYALNEDGETLSIASLAPDYAGDGNIVIRSVSGEIDGETYPVKAVADGAFQGNSGITSVTFENAEDIAVMGKAFQSMSSLKTVRFNGTGLVSVGTNDWDRTFGYNTALTSVTGTGYVSFDKMGTFEGCSGLETVSIVHIKLISRNTFIDNKHSLKVEARVIDKITYQGFNRCALTMLHIKEGTPDIENNWGGAIYDNEADLTLQFDGGVSRGIGGSVSLKEGCKLYFRAENTQPISICDWAFSSSPVVSVEITGPVDTIGGSAFDNCKSLETFRIDGSVGSFGGWSFNWCESLKTFEVTGKVTTLNGHAFNECDALETAVFGGGVSAIKTSAFYNCDALSTVRINGDVDSIESYGIDGCNALEKLIIMGKTGSVGRYAAKSSAMRVLVFKGGVKTMDYYVCGTQAFTAANSFIYVGSVGGYDSMHTYAFGKDRERGTAYFNTTFSKVDNALGGYSLVIGCYYTSEQSYNPDFYVRVNGSGGYGSSPMDAYSSYNGVMYSLYNRANSTKRFQDDVIAAGVEDLGLEFSGDMKPGFDGFTLHILADKNTSQAVLPADMYGSMLDYQGIDAPNSFDQLKAIVFESDVLDITIPDGALSHFPNLERVTVTNPDAKLTIGIDAFKETKVNNIATVEQTVASNAGKVTLAGGDAPIGTALVMKDSDGNYDEAVKAAISASSVFAEYDEDQIRIRYYDLYLAASDGSVVNKPARVSVTQRLGVYGVDTIAPKGFAFFHIEEDGTAKLATNEFTADLNKAVMTYGFDADGFSPYAAAYIPGAAPTSDGMYTYLADDDGNATITGYDTGFEGDVLNIPDTTTIGDKTYRVVGIAADALVNPPEGITIRSVEFHNEGSLLVGSNAMGGLRDIIAISFEGAGDLTFQDGTVFTGSGAGTVDVRMPNGLTAKTEGGNTGDVFSGITDGYALTVDSISSIPDKAFMGDKKLAEVTVVSALANVSPFEPAWVNSSRGNFTDCAIGTSAFEGASNLTTFTATNGTGESIAIGNEAFRDCVSLTSLNLGDKISGIGEHGLSNTGFTTLKLDTDNVEIGREGLAYIPNLKKLELGSVYGTGKYWLGGEGGNATKVEWLIFNGACVPQLYEGDIRGENLSVLVFKKGSNGITDGAIYAEDALNAETLTVYEGGQYTDNPYYRADGFPEGKKVRVYLNLPISNIEAHQSSSLITGRDIVDVGYAIYETASDIYVDTALDDDSCNSYRFNSFAKAREAAGQQYNNAEKFRGYFAEAGYDPSGLVFAEDTASAAEYTLHVIGGTDEIDDSFADDPKLKALIINLDSNYTKLEIDDGAFKGCSNLSELKFSTVGDLVFGESAFEDCTALSRFYIYAKYSLTIGEKAFSGCSGMESVTIDYMDDVTVGADAFAGTPVKEIKITRSCYPITIEKNAFRGLTGIHSVELSTYYGSDDITIEENAFADCGEITKVLITDSAAPTVKAGAFSGTTIGTLRIDSGSENVADGAFSGGEYYIDGGKTFSRNLANQTGNFRNIILTGPSSISESAKLFSGNPELQYVYLGQNTAKSGIGGEIFDGMPEDARAYIARKRTDYTDTTRPVRTDGVLRFLDDVEMKYIDGRTTKTTQDGSLNYPFKTFEQARASVIPAEDDGGERGSSYYDEGLADTLRTAYTTAGIEYKEADIRFPLPASETNMAVFYVLGTISISANEEWDSPEGTTIALLRNEGFTGVMVNVYGGRTLSLNNVILDGLNYVVSEPLIEVSSGGILNIGEGTEIRNNNRTGSYGNPDYAGAVFAYQSTVNMTGGVIAGNVGQYGGGIEVYGRNAQFNMSGGRIENNKVVGTKNSYGGGVMVGQSAVMNLSGGEISNNQATGGQGLMGGSGGGICLGGLYDFDCQQATLNMTDGTISGNTSALCGGGIYIQDNCIANISAGRITGNTCLGGEFGGGGIYVNGKRAVADGVLRLSNVLITGNTSAEEGGGIAGCNTSTSNTYLIQGGAIYGNHSGDGSDVYTDTIIRSSYGSGSMSGTVTAFMFNGAPYHWTDSRTGEEYTPGQLANMHNLLHESRVTLTANPDGHQPTTANVVISGNTSHTKGGGVGSNGTVIIGNPPPQQEVKWTPSGSKILWNRNMAEGETFTFRVVEEIKTEGNGYWWYYTDIPAGTGTVTGGKDGEAAAISFTEIDLGTVNGSDVGKYRTFLVSENQPEDSAITAPGFYLAYYVVLYETWDPETEKVGIAAEHMKTEKGKLTADGGYAFQNTWNGDVVDEAVPEHNFGRRRTKVSASDTVFHNYYGKTTVSADKIWLNYDGSDTPPEGASVVFELYADDKATGNTITLDGTTDENGETTAWTASWVNLDAYRKGEDGEPYKADPDDSDYVRIVYSVKEVSVTMPEGNQSVYVQGEAPVTADLVEGNIILNKQVTGDLTVSKTVNSDIEAHHDLEFRFTVTLSDRKISGEYGDMAFTGGMAEFTLKDGESATATGLPAGIGYAVEETPVKTFATTTAGDRGTITETLSEAVFTNTYEPVTGDLKVSKIVVSEVEEHHDAVFSFTVTLGDRNVNGTYGDMTFENGAAEFTLKDGESATATGLPAGVSYTVTEAAVSPFTTTKTGDQGTISETLSEAVFINSYEPVPTPTPTPTPTPSTTPPTTTTPPSGPEPELQTLEVAKVWNDQENQDGIRPEQISVMLLAEGVEVTTVILNEENSWSASVKDLPAEAGGRAVIYEWIEEETSGYTLNITHEGNRTILTNTHVPEETEATIVKVWNDAENQDGIRPDGLTVTLSDGTEVTLNAENKWTATVEHLPKFEAGKEIEYTWTEGELPEGYELTDTSVEGMITTLTNTHVPEVTEVTVKKIWNDDNNAQNSRPARIIMTLSNGMQAELNAENGWTVTISELPVNRDGKPITYTWTEQAIVGYQQVSVSTEGNVTTFTNRLVPVPDPPKGNKTPKVPHEPPTLFEEYDTPLGVDVIINHVGDCFD